MKRLYTCALVLAAAALALTATATATRPVVNTPVGSNVADFKLPDAAGKEHTLSSLKGKNGAVLIFVSTKCPVSNGYNERMEKLAQDLKARGVAVIGINANVAETAADVKQHAADNKLTFTILKDTGNVIADRLGAAVTPEAFYLDAASKLVYKGRLDNNSRDASAVTASELRDAVEATLAGRPVEKSEVRAYGCSIKRAS